jgi:uncharacterized protein (DUF934 family)
MRFIDPATDRWQPLAESEEPRPHALLSLEQWNALRDRWPSESPVGVGLPNTADVEELAADVARWALVVLHFPKWTDGRAYSQARLLRARLRFGSEVRASGDVVTDMLPLLQRSGFDAAHLRADQDRVSAQRALHFFERGHYQGDVLQSRPLFARPA